MIRLAMMSVAETSVIPMQDVLGLGSEGPDERAGEARGATGAGACCRAKSTGASSSGCLS